MGKHLLANMQVAKSNELTVSEVTELTSSTVDETAMALLNRQGSRGIPIVILHRKFNGFKYTYKIDGQHTLNWQQRTFKLPHITKTPRIASSY
jgi:hypothetical protein